MDPGLAYRGQGRDYPLVPSLFRDGHACQNFSDWRHYEQTLVRLFDRESHPYLESIPDFPLDWLALAQHHGLPTRLLDWSSSPIIALYFAVCDLDEAQDGQLWSYNAKQVRFESYKNWEELYAESETPLYVPRNKFQRVGNQKGCFTVHPIPGARERFISFEDAQNDDFSLTLNLVAKECKFKIMKDLDDMGINEGFIYPGLDGLSGKIKWKIKRHRISMGAEQGFKVTQRIM